MEADKPQLPPKKRVYCELCGKQREWSDTPGARRQREYRQRKRRRTIEQAEQLRFCIEEFMNMVGPCFEDMPAEEDLLTDEYEDELQKVEAGAQSDCETAGK